MFGLLDLNACGLAREKRYFYSCMVCDALASRFGRRSRAMLSNDSVYLSLLIAAQRDQIPYDFTRHNRCQPWSRRSLFLPDFEYPAAVSVLIGGIKLFDDTHDVASFRSRVLYALWRSRVREAEEKLRELGLSLPSIADLVNEQHRRETVIGRELGYYWRISEEIYSKVFSHTATLAGVPSNVNHLAKVGLHVGRVAYLLDNYVDLSNDRRKSLFNLFSSISSIDPDIVGPDDSKRFLEDQLTQSLQHIRESILRVRLHRFHTSIRHIVAKGLEMKVRKAIATTGTALSAPTIYAFALAGIPLVSKSRLASGESDCCDCSSLCPTPQEICAQYIQTTLAGAVAHVQEGVIAAVVGGLASLAVSSIASHRAPGSAAPGPSPPSTSETGLPADKPSQSPSEKPWYEGPEPPDLSPDERSLRRRLRMRDQMERLGWDVDYEILPGTTPPQYQARAVERYMKCANPACPGKLILRRQLKEDPWINTSSLHGAVINRLMDSALGARTVCPHCGMKQKYIEPKRYTVPVEG